MQRDEFWARYAFQPYELVRGHVVPLRKLTFRSSIVALRIASRLEEHIAQLSEPRRPLGEVLRGDGSFALSAKTVRTPRVAFISRAKMQRIRYPYRYMPFAPDLIVDVVAHGEDDAPVKFAVQQYLRAGTRLAWVFYPDYAHVIAIGQDGEALLLRGSATLTGAPVLPDFNVLVAHLLPGRKASKVKRPPS